MLHPETLPINRPQMLQKRTRSARPVCYQHVLNRANPHFHCIHSGTVRLGNKLKGAISAHLLGNGLIWVMVNSIGLN
ncbi:hypothetical protein Hanom_Chr12g01112641 [Helianthus anomalus]